MLSLKHFTDIIPTKKGYVVNKAKLLVTILMFNLLLVGCKDAYIKQQNPMSPHLETKASSDVSMMQRGENPMDRPSYDEYKKKY